MGTEDDHQVWIEGEVIMAKNYPCIQKADGTEPIELIDGIQYKPIEYVTVYRNKYDDNNICYESSEELTRTELIRLQAEGKTVTSEFIGGVGCIYGMV